jgi:hypothetical protein
MSIWLPLSINPGSVLARAYGASHLRKKSETKWGGVASIFLFPRALISTRRALHDGWSCLRPSVTPSFQGAAAHRSRSTRSPPQTSTAGARTYSTSWADLCLFWGPIRDGWSLLTARSRWTTLSRGSFMPLGFGMSYLSLAVRRARANAVPGRGDKPVGLSSGMLWVWPPRTTAAARRIAPKPASAQQKYLLARRVRQSPSV